MAKNFTQFQEVSGETTSDGVRTTNLDTYASKDDFYVVGYIDDAPGGEAKFSLRSILIAADPADIGLNNVTNESKTTMFSSPTFTEGATIEGDLQVNGNVVATGNNTSVDTLVVTTSAIDANNNNTAVPLQVTQETVDGNYDTMRVYSGDEFAMHVNNIGRVGIGTSADDRYQLTIGHITGQDSSEATVFINGTLSATAVNGADVAAMDEKLDTIQPWADSVYALQDVSSRLQQMQDDGLNNINVAKGYDLLEDGETYIKTLSAFILAPYNLNGGHRASDAWHADEGFGLQTPPRQSEAGYGTWDASWEKLRKIEALADNTRANSNTIEYNQVPDGEWTGDATTTFMKMTSAEKALLGEDGLRRVSGTLFADDDGDIVTQSYILSAYEEAAGSYYWSEQNDDEYTGITQVRDAGTEGVKPRAMNSVQNTLDGNNVRVLDDGDAVLNEVEVSSLSAQDVVISNQLGVQGTGAQTSGIYAGLTTEINVGGHKLYFSDGVLWKVETLNANDGTVTNTIIGTRIGDA
jgi:hypothetical protein